MCGLLDDTCNALLSIGDGLEDVGHGLPRVFRCCLAIGTVNDLPEDLRFPMSSTEQRDTFEGVLNMFEHRQETQSHPSTTQGRPSLSKRCKLLDCLIITRCVFQHHLYPIKRKRTQVRQHPFDELERNTL